MFQKAVVVAALLLVVNGVLHGIWSHRWTGWSEDAGRSDRVRVDDIPLAVGDWVGERVALDPLTHPEEMVGRGVSVRYTNRIDRATVLLYFACGPTDGLVSHTPAACYVANGFTAVPPDLRASPAGGADGEGPQFWVSQFSRTQSGVPTYQRVFWSLSDGTTWQCPDNPRRAFRRAAAINKCYAVREVISPDEPVEGDPCLKLLAALLPHLDGAARP